MENSKYIQLFEKFLRKEATQEETKLLIKWLKSQGYSQWSAGHWELVSAEMDPALQRKIFSDIKDKIQYTPKEQFLLKHISRKLYQWSRRVAVILLLIITGIFLYLQSPPAEDMRLSIEKGQKSHDYVAGRHQSIGQFGQSFSLRKTV